MNSYEEFFGDIVDEGNEERYEKRFIAHAEFKAEGDEQEERLIKGMASTRFEDRHNEIILPRAFKSTLEQFTSLGKILLNHGGGMFASPEERLPIGVPVDAKIRDNGLWLKARIGRGDLIDKVWSRIQQGLLNAFSIGFMTKAAKWITVKDDSEQEGERKIRAITDLELFEVSVVSIPANRLTHFNITKALNFGNDLADSTVGEFTGRKPENEQRYAALEMLRDVNAQISERLALNDARAVAKISDGIQKRIDLAEARGVQQINEGIKMRLALSELNKINRRMK